MTDRPVFDPKNFATPKIIRPADIPRDNTAFNPGAIKAQLEGKRQAVVDLRTAPLGPLKAWSFSRLMEYESCPYAVYLAKIEKAPNPSGPAAERGTQIHEHIEGYIQGLHTEVIKPMQGFLPLINQLRDGFVEATVEIEGDWAFDRQWQRTGWNDKDCWARVKLDAIEFESPTSAAVYDWKGLALDTKLPTPTGWTTMADVQKGDTLFGANGAVCQVVGKSQVHNRPCFRITFDDTSTVVCDDEHLWALTDGRVLSTAELHALRATGKQLRMNTAAPTALPEIELPIDPYILGLWLGDGKHTSGEICKPDSTLWDYVAERGFTTGADISGRGDHATSKTVYGLRKSLRLAGILGNKHIPAAYLRASNQQRIDLLRGLMDSDGNANPHRKQCVFTTCDRAMSDAVMELLLSLGQRPNQAITTQRGFGLTVTAYPIHFRPTHGLKPFMLPRKADRVGDWGPGNSLQRRVLRIDPIESVPTQCIAVDSPDNTYLCTERMLVTHNTGRKFGNELKHNQQGMTYAIAAFKRYPELEFIASKFVYLDQNDDLKGQYTRAQAMMLEPMLTERADKLTTATEFPPKPSFSACRWCPHGKIQEGRDRPACDFAHENTLVH